MSNMDSTEVEAASVEEATREALEQLGAREDEVTIEVIATPRAGVLGLGARQARVRVTRKAAEAAGASTPGASQAPQARDGRGRGRENQRRGRGDDRSQSQNAPASSGDDDSGAAGRKSADVEEQRREAMAILKQILEQMGEPTDVRQVEVDAETVEIEIKGDGSGILIGRHGQTLDALEYIVNRILARRIKDAAPISLETESYRARRRQQLHRMALSMGEKAKREHKPVRLEPMPPRDRRVVHLALKDDPMITTRSAGDGTMRSIEIVPMDSSGRPQPRGEGQPRGGRRREGEREPQREQEREVQRIEPERGNEAIGEQGGFKHGQKRIV
jgi:spoIIIJ-associated protein